MRQMSEKDQKIDSVVRVTLHPYPLILLSYYEHLIQNGKNFSTAQAYIRNLLRFFNSLFELPFPDDFYTQISSKHIQAYLNHATGSNTDAINRTNAAKWSALNSFFSFLVPNHIISNPLASIPRPETKSEIDITYLSKAELESVLSSVHKKARLMNRNRDLSILMLGFYRGLSNAEIVALNVDDINLESGKLIIRKNNNHSTISINKTICDQLSLWISDRQQYFSPCSDDALFVSSLRSRISSDALGALVSKYEDGITKHITPQTMRNTCLINLYKQTGDIGLCSKYLRLKTIDQTKRYIENLASISSRTEEEASSVLDTFYFKNDIINDKKSDSFCRLKCELLRQIRKEIAEINGLDYPMPPCHYNGFCTGHCELAETEIAYLDSRLNQKAQIGQRIQIASFSLTSIPMVQEWLEQHSLLHNGATQLSLFDSFEEHNK